MVSAAHIAISSATRGHVHSGSSGEPADAGFVFLFVLPILILAIALPFIILGRHERRWRVPTVPAAYHPVGRWAEPAARRPSPTLTRQEMNACIVSQMEAIGLTLADYTPEQLRAMGYVELHF